MTNHISESKDPWFSLSQEEQLKTFNESMLKPYTQALAMLWYEDWSGININRKP